jgi:hypothetical protein
MKLLPADCKWSAVESVKGALERARDGALDSPWGLAAIRASGEIEDVGEPAACIVTDRSPSP